MYKKFLSIIILVLFSFCTVGCNNNNDNSKKDHELEKISLKVDKLIPLGEKRGIIVKYHPSDSYKDISWSSSDENVATVEDGKIITNNVGKTKIEAQTSNGKTAAINIEVYKEVEELKLNHESLKMYVGDSIELKASISPNDATYKKIKWTSSNDVVSIKDGLITANKIGEATITAELEKNQGSVECVVNVVEKPIEFSGSGDKIISDLNIPRGEYIANIKFNSSRYHGVKFYYGSEDYDYELLVNDSGKPYSGITLLKGGSTDAVNGGILQIETTGSWTIKIEKLTGKASFPLSGNGDMVTGVFEGSGKREIFNINFESSRYHGVKLYKYNGTTYDYELLVNDSGKPYSGQVMASTKKGEKYFFTIETEGNWSIDKQ